MQFLYPTFLFALAAILIPIIIHLFHFRRFKKVYFTNVRFLKEVKEETASRSRLKHLLVLLSRILAICFLVFAFAQPFIPKDNEVKKGQKAISIFIDNSFSMEAVTSDVPLVEKAKQRAKEIVNAYEVDDRFQILTNDFEGRHQRLVSQEDAISYIDEISVSPSVKTMSRIANRQQQLLSSSKIDNKISYIISDFQKNITDFTPISDSLITFNLIPLQSVEKRNVTIDSAWFEAPVQALNKTNRLIVKIRNLGNEAAENVRVTLRHQGQVKPMGTLNVPPRSALQDTVNVTLLKAGLQSAQVNITDYPVQFDDTYYLAFDVPEKVNVLNINEGSSNRYLEAILKSVTYFEHSNQASNRLDYSKLDEYDLIILNELKSISSGLAAELKEYIEEGGNLLVFPHAQSNIASYKSFLSSIPANELMNFESKERQVGRVNTEEFVFKDVYENKTSNLKLPTTKGSYRLTNFGSRAEEQLLTFRDGTTFVGKYRSGQGHLYLSAAPLDTDYADLVQNAEIFVPMIYKMAISTGKAQPISYTIGKDETLETTYSSLGNETVFKLRNDAQEFIPEQRRIGSKVVLGVNNQIKEAGFYQLSLDDNEPLTQYAFNYDRKESDLQYLSQSELAQQVGDAYQIINTNEQTDFTNLIGERSRGVALWKWCLILALVFLAIEILLLRLWKV